MENQTHKRRRPVLLKFEGYPQKQGEGWVLVLEKNLNTVKTTILLEDGSEQPCEETPARALFCFARNKFPPFEESVLYRFSVEAFAGIESDKPNPSLCVKYWLKYCEKVAPIKT